MEIDLKTYILVEGEPVFVSDPLEWAEHLNKNRVIEKTIVTNVKVSTVFLGIDHNHSTGGPPILFETMIFGGKLHELCWRYTSVLEAKGAHWQIVRGLKKNNNVDQVNEFINN